MKKELKGYISELEKIIKDNNIYKGLDEEVLIWIRFFQHERFIHLLVTIFVGISTILFLLGFLLFDNIHLRVVFWSHIFHGDTTFTARFYNSNKK